MISVATMDYYDLHVMVYGAPVTVQFKSIPKKDKFAIHKLIQIKKRGKQERCPQWLKMTIANVYLNQKLQLQNVKKNINSLLI